MSVVINNQQTITVDDISYDISDLTKDQLLLVNHISDLEQKISGSRFQLDQLMVARDAFNLILKESLNKKE